MQWKRFNIEIYNLISRFQSKVLSWKRLKPKNKEFLRCTMDFLPLRLIIFRSHSEESESSESEDEEIQGRDEKLNESTTHDDSSDDINDFATIRTSSPCPEKEKDESINMDVDSNDGKCYLFVARAL